MHSLPTSLAKLSVLGNSEMKQQLSAVALLVRDYDEAIAWYTGILGFDLVEDTDLGEGKRWVRVRPRGAQETCLLLAKASGEQQESHVGSQAGGRVMLFLDTDNFARDYAAYLAQSVEFEGEPRHEPYGTVAVFKDLYGNRWDLIERKI